MELYNNSYYDWYNKAERAGTIDRALLEYYNGNSNLYTIRVDNETYKFPVLAKTNWDSTDNSLDSVIEKYIPKEFSNYNMGTVEEIVNRIAAGMNDLSPEVEDYLFNGLAIQPMNLPSEDSQINVRDSDYFTKLMTDFRLSNELGQQLFESGISPTPSQDSLEDVMESVSLPVREKFGENIETIEKRLPERTAPFGLNALLVFNTGDDYRIFIGKRSEDLIVYPGTWALTPAGGIKPMNGEINCEANLLKEYGEEILSVEEHTEDALEHPGVRKLRKFVETKKAHIDFLGVCIPANRLSVNLSSFILIDDPEYYNQYIRGRDLTNSEVADFQLIPVDAGEKLKKLLNPEQFLPGNVMTLLEGLRHLETNYGIDCGLSLTRIQP